MTGRSQRALILSAVIAAALAWVCASAQAAGPSQYCEGGASAGAVNQYCEDLPGVGGAQPISGASKALAATLAPPVLKRLDGHDAPAGSRALLTLPAASTSSGSIRPRSRTAVAAITPPAGRHASTPELWLAVVVVALIVLGGLDALRRRRHRSG